MTATIGVADLEETHLNRTPVIDQQQHLNIYSPRVELKHIDLAPLSPVHHAHDSNSSTLTPFAGFKSYLTTNPAKRSK